MVAAAFRTTTQQRMTISEEVEKEAGAVPSTQACQLSTGQILIRAGLPRAASLKSVGVAARLLADGRSRNVDITTELNYMPVT